MGLFSSIGKVFKGVAKVAAPFVPLAGDVFSAFQASKGVANQNVANISNAREAADFNANQALLNRNWQHDEASDARSFNRYEAAKNRFFQEKMSNTAHAREVRDLRRAGLNPILSAKYGGSSTPSGATATTSAPSGSTASRQAAHSQDEIGPAISTALQTRRLHQEIKNLEAQEALTRTQQTKVQAEIPNVTTDTEHKKLKLTTEERLASKLGAETNESIERLKNLASQKNLTDAQKAKAEKEAEVLVEELKYLRQQRRIDESEYGEMLRWLERILPFLRRPFR